MQNVLSKAAEIAKAITAGLAAAVTAAAAGADWKFVIASAILSAAITYRVPNRAR